MNFEKFTDEELCEKAKEGDVEAESYLIKHCICLEETGKT